MRLPKSDEQRRKDLEEFKARAERISKQLKEMDEGC